MQARQVQASMLSRRKYVLSNEVENTLNEIKKAITGINAQLKNCNSEIQKNVEVLESLKVLVDEASVEVKNLK